MFINLIDPYCDNLYFIFVVMITTLYWSVCSFVHSFILQFFYPSLTTSSHPRTYTMDGYYSCLSSIVTEFDYATDDDSQTEYQTTLPSEGFYNVDYTEPNGDFTPISARLHRVRSTTHSQLFTDTNSVSDDSDVDDGASDSDSDNNFTNTSTFLPAKKKSTEKYNRRQKSFHSTYQKSLSQATVTIINRDDAPSPLQKCAYCSAVGATFRCSTCFTHKWMCSTCSDNHLSTSIYHRVGKSSISTLLIYILWSMWSVLN